MPRFIHSYIQQLSDYWIQPNLHFQKKTLDSIFLLKSVILVLKWDCDSLWPHPDENFPKLKHFILFSTNYLTVTSILGHKIAQNPTQLLYKWKPTDATVALQLWTNVGTKRVYFSGVASTSGKHITGLFPLITCLKLNV